MQIDAPLYPTPLPLVGTTAHPYGASSIFIEPRTGIRAYWLNGYKPPGANMNRSKVTAAHIVSSRSWPSDIVILNMEFTMKITLVALVFATVVAATPYPWAAPQASIVPSSGRPRRNRTDKNTHKEPTPTFKTSCECVKPIVPINLLSANEASIYAECSTMIDRS